MLCTCRAALRSPVGKFTNVDGQGNCLSCDSGTFAAKVGLTICGKCAKGYYSVKNDSSGAAECSPTPLGTFTDVGASAPVSCPAGEFQNVTGQGQCRKCMKGYHAPDPHTVDCRVRS